MASSIFPPVDDLDQVSRVQFSILRGGFAIATMATLRHQLSTCDWIRVALEQQKAKEELRRKFRNATEDERIHAFVTALGQKPGVHAVMRGPDTSASTFNEACVLRAFSPELRSWLVELADGSTLADVKFHHLVAVASLVEEKTECIAAMHGVRPGADEEEADGSSLKRRRIEQDITGVSNNKFSVLFSNVALSLRGVAHSLAE